MPEHTKGRLSIHIGEDYCHIYGGEYDNSENPLAIIPSGSANAFRFAACWHACAGINPEAVGEMLKALKAVQSDIELDSGNYKSAPGGSTELSLMVEAAIELAEK